jgi:pimeloyl-ACP methyl ester carboxylesterase
MATFVLIHGAFSGGWTWCKVIPFLEKAGHTVFAPDMPGHGKNRMTSAQEITLQTCVDCVIDILDRQVEPAILVGHSMGGMIISQTAEQRPHKIKKLVYVCGFLLKDGESLLSRGGGHHDPINAPYEKFKEFLCEDCADADAKWMRALLVPPAGKLAGTAIHVTSKNYGRIPRIYIQCLRDKAIPPPVQKQMYTDTPCERIITMDTSHMPLISAPEELAKNLLSVLTV